MGAGMLGCIADDFTGATDLASNLACGGMKVVQTIGIPEDSPAPNADAVVIALKSRTIPPGEAVRLALDALRWLREHGAGQIYFKYCSTFDSTAQGNIGPVTEALMDALGIDFTIAAPAFPDNGRKVFRGHLFVGDELLHESGMQHHPLTPMTDANLVRVLQAQTRAHKVGLIGHEFVSAGAGAVRERISRLRAQQVGIAIVDSVSNDDLHRVGAALNDQLLITGGSGLGMALASNFGISRPSRSAVLPRPRGHQVVLAGSCSPITQRQIRHFMATGRPVLELDPFRICSGGDVVAEALAWAMPRLGSGPVLLHVASDVDRVRSVQAQFGAERAASLIEQMIATLAQELVRNHGVRQLVTAGGETSGACLRELGVEQLTIGPQIDPGVPWCYTAAEPGDDGGIHLALKSGNFGADDFFTRAFAIIA